MPEKVVTGNRADGPWVQGQELGWSVEGTQAQVTVQPISPPEVMPPQRGLDRICRKRLERSRRKTAARSQRRPKGKKAPLVPPRQRPEAKIAKPKAPRRSPHPTSQPSRRSRTHWSLSLVFLMGLGITGGLALMSVFWLTSLPPAPECDRVSRFSPDTERLFCAQEAARSGELSDLKAAVELVQDWGSQHPLHAESQQWLGRWSRNLMEVARQRHADSDLKGALEIAALVPESSPFYEEAQATIAEWQSEWEAGEAIYTIAQEALKQQNWSEASQQLVALGQLTSPYWREQRMEQLTQRIFAERTSWTALQSAQRLARQEAPENLQAALVKLDEVLPQTYAWEAAQTDRQRWGQTLAEQGWQRWQEGDTVGAIALAQTVPLNVPLEGDLAHLVRYSHAQGLADWQIESGWRPSPWQIWRLREAIAALQTIPRDSALYATAQANLADWEAQLADVTQLQVASAIASLGQQQALELAIRQAEGVNLERPRRLQAQTLIAYWRDEIQRLQDRPVLVRALDIASSKAIPDLQRAIALTETIGPDRALHEEAQQQIAEWVAHIQTVEDQPILDRARQLAEENKLREAIREARKIQQGRALYAEANAAANGWQAEIDRVLIAEDRRILDQANGLAARGSLTRAIETASGIGRDRPLYSEARASIQQWQAERDAVWESWSAPAYEEPAPIYEEPAPIYEEPLPEAVPPEGGEVY